MKIDFSQVIFADESQVKFDWPDKWGKSRNLSNSDVSVAKRRQQEGGSVRIWAEIVNQIIIRPFKVDKKKLNWTVLTIAIL